MFLAVDTETTGMYNFRAEPGAQCQPRIVQLAALLIDDERNEQAMFNTLVSPRTSPLGTNQALGWVILHAGADLDVEWAIPAEAQAIHGISTQDCLRFGMPLLTVLDVLSAMAERSQMVVAHNVAFDGAMIASEFTREGRTIPKVMHKRYCTMEESTDIVGISGRFGGYKWPKLSEAYRFFFNEELKGAHDALADVRACARIFFALQDRTKVGAR